jgi:hypothetical protein
LFAFVVLRDRQIVVCQLSVAAAMRHLVGRDRHTLVASYALRNKANQPHIWYANLEETDISFTGAISVQGLFTISRVGPALFESRFALYEYSLEE